MKHKKDKWNKCDHGWYKEWLLLYHILTMKIIPCVWMVGSQFRFINSQDKSTTFFLPGKKQEKLSPCIYLIKPCHL